jgi:hypothetical protein
VFETQLLISYEKIVWLILSGCQAVLLLRLCYIGLVSRYKWFAAYLGIQVLQAAALFRVNRDSEAYAYSYMAVALLMAVVALLVVLELYGMVLKDYAGIGSLGRWMISGGWCVAALITLVTLVPDLANTSDAYPRLLALAIFQRAVNSALLVFMLIISGFLAWFPVPLSRNTVLHTILFAVMFSSTAILLLLRNTMGYDSSPYHLLSAIEMTVHLLCLLGWITLLKPQGESKTMVVGHRWQRGQSDRLVGQLDAINSSLLRAARNNPHD